MGIEEYDYSKQLIDKETAVTTYGSKGQLNYFSKYNKLTSVLESGLILTLEQYYDSVDKVKVGRSIQYQLGDKRSTVAQRNDGRSFLGAKSKTALTYTKDMDVVVANYLNGGTEHEDRTLKHWLNDIGIISNKMLGAMNARRNLYNENTLINDLFDEKIIREEADEHIVNDYLQVNEELVVQLQKVFRRLEKNGSITIKNVYFKKIKTATAEQSFSDAQAEIVKVSEEEYLNHKEEELNLLKKYNITAWESLYGKNEGRVKKYRKEKNGNSKIKNDSDRVKVFFYFSSIGITKNCEDVVLAYLKSYGYDSDEYISDKELFVKNSNESFKSKRYDRVKEKMNDKITKRFNNDIRDMKKFGVKKSKKFKPAEYNKVVDKLQYKYTGVSKRGR